MDFSGPEVRDGLCYRFPWFCRTCGKTTWYAVNQEVPTGLWEGCCRANFQEEIACDKSNVGTDWWKSLHRDGVAKGMKKAQELIDA